MDMKILINNTYIDFSTVVNIEIDERFNIYRPDTNELIITSFATDKKLHLRANYTKIKSFCIFRVGGELTLEPYLKLVSNTSEKGDLQWFQEDEADKLRFEGDFLYLKDDYRQVWNEFKEDIFDKWNNTESAIKDIQIYN